VNGGTVIRVFRLVILCGQPGTLKLFDSCWSYRPDGGGQCRAGAFFIFPLLSSGRVGLSANGTLFHPGCAIGRRNSLAGYILVNTVYPVILKPQVAFGNFSWEYTDRSMAAPAGIRQSRTWALRIQPVYRRHSNSL